MAVHMCAVVCKHTINCVLLLIDFEIDQRCCLYALVSMVLKYLGATEVAL